MSRPPRLEFPGAHYHILNRGNYRSHVFATTGARTAFLATLAEAAPKLGWRVHAWALMANHFHIALETPHPNLVEGMQWLQGTFAARFNRFRGAHGHLFQGRYKSLLVEHGQAFGALCHYIHLNPVRARLCRVEALGQWPWTSLNWMLHPSQRPAWYDANTALAHPGAWADTPAGWQGYITYLNWMQETEPARKIARFDRMSKGWVIGSQQFKANLAAERHELAKRSTESARELGTAHAERLLMELLAQFGRTTDDLRRDPKSAPWKIALAAALKQRTHATNRWLGERLHAGSLHQVSRKVTAWQRASKSCPLAEQNPTTTNDKA
jgi:putative transposase